jgi:protein PhnA
MENTYEDGSNYMCADCAHEWPINQTDDEPAETDGIVRDANGNPLADGDAV